MCKMYQKVINLLIRNLIGIFLFIKTGQKCDVDNKCNKDNIDCIPNSIYPHKDEQGKYFLFKKGDNFAVSFWIVILPNKTGHIY